MGSVGCIYNIRFTQGELGDVLLLLVAGYLATVRAFARPRVVPAPRGFLFFFVPYPLPGAEC